MFLQHPCFSSKNFHHKTQSSTFQDHYSVGTCLFGCLFILTMSNGNHSPMVTANWGTSYVLRCKVRGICVCVCVCIQVFGACFWHTLSLCSPLPCPSSPLNHQIQYIIFSIGPFEFPLLFLNELVLSEPAGNGGPGALELHFCYIAIYFPHFSQPIHCKLHFPECTALYLASILFP